MKTTPIIIILLILSTLFLAGCGKETTQVEPQESAVEPAGEIEEMPEASEDVDIVSDDDVDIGGDLI